ncbi:MAG TPA: cytochrome P460 family protein [Vicinamibacterales bacterium]|nr:cytochrome P460 family protein [Vicinamibacterales bacterium]
MTQAISHVIGRVVLSCAVVAWVAVVATHPALVAQQRPVPATAAVTPQYDADRNLKLPADYRQWILVGSSLGLSYSEAGAGHQMFNTTLMEPTAYRHFVETGQFREGTMLALILQGIGTNALPARQGQFATDVHMIEMAVKDSGRVPEGWAYYGFGGPMMGGYRTAAAPQAKASCYDCHVKHAARDNVFTQFYGLLNEAAPRAK